MRRLIPFLSAAIALVAPLFVAAPAHAAPYVVTLAVSHPRADVGQTIRFTGAVSGQAVKKRLAVQRRIGAGGWATIATVTTDAKKRYVFNHKVSAVGAQQFRVVAPAQGRTSQGVSAARAFTGWTWLDLTVQPHVARSHATWGNTRCSGTICRPRTIETVVQGSVATFKLEGKCDASQIWMAVPNESPSGTYGAVIAAQPVQGTAWSQSYPLAPGTWALGTTMVTPSTYQLTLSKTHASADPVYFGTPIVRCSVPRLAEY